MGTNRIETLIEKMSLEEKIAQLHGVWITDLLENGRLSAQKCRKLLKHGVGHVAQFASTNQLLPNQLKEIVDDLQKYLKNETKSKIPAMIHEEAITGVAARGATVTPQMIGMSCSWDPKLVYENALMTAENMKKLGCFYALSPMIDVVKDARWGRAEEGYGEDSYLVAEFGLAFIKGLQEGGAAATAKHFAGYGEENQDMAFVRNESLLPFEVAVKQGNVQAIMPGYHTFHDVPCSASKLLINDILRNEWGFGGVVVSDYESVQMISGNYHYVNSVKEAAVAAFQAGVDVDFPEGNSFKHLIEAVGNGEIDEAEIDCSLRRVLTLKERLGLFDWNPEEGETELDAEINRERALHSAHRAVVLLKNDGTLPLKKSVSRIAVVGPNADSYYSMLGDYTHAGIGEFFHGLKGERENPKIVTLLEGLKNRLGTECDIRYERGCDWSNGKDVIISPAIGDGRGAKMDKTPLEDVPYTDWHKAIQTASESDVIIAAMGENRFLCGENCNRDDVCLPGDQEKFVNELCETGKPVVMVVFGGRAMAVSQIAEKCAAVIYAWYPGEEGGNALADIMTGNVNPSGKLTVSLPNSNADVPVFYQQGEKAEKCKYPFGFGLTYTDFEYSDLRAPAQISVNEPYFDVSFTLSNTGKVSGTEIAQVYMVQKGKPKKLIGYCRTHLEEGEKKEAVLRFYTDSFAKYDADGNLFLNPADFCLQIGASSADIKLSAEINFAGETRKIKEKLHYFSEVIK